MINNRDDQPDSTRAPDQIVVAMAHSELVSDVLWGTLHVGVAKATPDPRLGLVLFDLGDGFENYADRLRATPLSVVGQLVKKKHPEEFAKLQEGQSAAWPFSDLDALLLALRTEIERRYGGWTPLLGKNRDVTISGSPNPQPITGAFASATLLDLEIGGAVSMEVQDVPHRVADSADAGRGVRVGILDTKLYPHDRLAGQYIAPDDALHPPKLLDAVQPVAGHATFIADLICRQAPKAELVVDWVLNDEGTAAVWAAAKAMMRFADAGIDVLNLSFGCFTVDGETPLVLRRATELLIPKMVIVAAAGNHGKPADGQPEAVDPKAIDPNSPAWPAAFNDVVAVGAHRSDDPSKRADFSPELPWMQFTAMGTRITGAFIDADVKIPHKDADVKIPNKHDPVPSMGHARWGGTSFAAATVSGVIAARTRPGQRSAHEALAELTDDPYSVVKKYPWS